MQIDIAQDKMLSQSRKLLERQYPPKMELNIKNFHIKIYRKIRNSYSKYDFYYFSWPTASLALALEIGYAKTEKKELLDTLESYYKYWMKKGSRIYRIEQIMNGYTMIFLSKQRDKDYLNNGIHKMYHYIKEYPKTSTGSMPYRRSNPKKVLVDYLGMVCPFLSRYAVCFDCREALDYAVSFLEDFLRSGIDNRTGLPYHAFRTDTYEKMGIIGWGRSVGWLLRGIVETLEYLNRESDKHIFLRKNFKKILNSSIKFQDEEGYFKWMLPARDGHIDTSATAMIGYSIKRAIDLEILGENFLPYAEKSLQALHNKTENGVVFDSSAECEGVGKYPPRFESNQWGQGFGTAFALSMVSNDR